MKCLKCGIDLEKYKPIKRGWRHNMKGRIQKFQCKRCGYKFTKAGVAFRMRAPRWKILKAIELRDKGQTLAQIANQLGGISRQTVLSWIKDRRRLKNKTIIAERMIRGHYRTMPALTPMGGKIRKWVMPHKAKLRIRI